MNCELAHEHIVTAAYGELPDEQIHELERHMTGCPDCHRDREQLQALQVLAGANPVSEPSPNLVARSRQRLEEALDALPPKGWYERLTQRMTNNFASLQSAPVAACLLLLIGAGAGSLASYEVQQSRAARNAGQAGIQATIQDSAPVSLATRTIADRQLGQAPAEIASISSIVRQPNTERVEVHYNQLVPLQIEGSLDDPKIRELLMVASEDSASAGVRDDSVGLLAAECRAGHRCQASGIRDALIVALRYDKNAGVRLKALDGLESYVAVDMRVRDAVLEALMNDPEARVRTEAINILEPVEADTTVRQVLHTVARSDQSPQIRTVSREVLSRVPEIQ